MVAWPDPDEPDELLVFHVPKALMADEGTAVQLYAGQDGAGGLTMSTVSNASGITGVMQLASSGKFRQVSGWVSLSSSDDQTTLLGSIPSAMDTPSAAYKSPAVVYTEGNMISPCFVSIDINRSLWVTLSADFEYSTASVQVMFVLPYQTL